jgi:hypothetical protein
MEKKKPVKRSGLPLHQFVATGGKPKDFKGALPLDSKKK